jgi:hypothetical protein
MQLKNNFAFEGYVHNKRKELDNLSFKSFRIFNETPFLWS